MPSFDFFKAIPNQFLITQPYTLLVFNIIKHKTSFVILPECLGGILVLNIIKQIFDIFKASKIWETC